MTILEEVLESIQKNPLIDQVRILCDTILEEEKDNMEYIDFRQKGPNVFLSLQVPGRDDDEIGFLTLERDVGNKWVTIFRTLDMNSIREENTKLIYIPRKSWEINETEPKKILKEYAKAIKYTRGE